MEYSEKEVNKKGNTGLRIGLTKTGCQGVIKNKSFCTIIIIGKGRKGRIHQTHS
jgi:Fe-S cluster assembly iron-binding protein IscA